MDVNQQACETVWALLAQMGWLASLLFLLLMVFLNKRAGFGWP